MSTDPASPLPVLTTARLRLRQFIPGDAPAWQRMMDDEQVMRYFPTSALPDLERAQKWVARQITHWHERACGLWAATLPPDGALVGWCGLQFLTETGETEVAYMIARSQWGNGYASEAARASLQYGFGPAGLEEIIALVHPQNAASIRVIEKQAMHYTGMAEYFGMALRRYVLPRGDFMK